MPEQTTTSVIPVVGTFEQIKAGLGFGPKRAESKLDATVDGIAGLVNTIAEPQGKRLNRLTEEWAQVVEALEDGVQGVALADRIIAMAATQGIQITHDQLFQQPPTPPPTLPVGIPTPASFTLPGGLTLDAAGNVILDPRFPTSLAARVSPPTGARGLGFTAPSGFPILPPSGPSRGAPAPSVDPGFLARFVNCLTQALLPTQGGRRMPFVTTGSFASNQGGFDFGGFLGGALDIARNIFSPPQAPAQRFPELQMSAFPLLPALSGVRSLAGPLAAGGVGGAAQGFIESLFQTGGAATLDEGAAFTDPIPGSCRPKAHVKKNPCTGKGIWFVPRGRPLVFSGDMSACKRVDRVAKRLDKARPKRRHHHHTKRRPR